jgi:hypothetical protein
MEPDLFSTVVRAFFSVKVQQVRDDLVQVPASAADGT